MKKKAFSFKLLPSQKIKILTTKRLLRCLIFIGRCILLLKYFLQRSLNDNINKVKSCSDSNNLAFDSHYQMVTIHPFTDGNGRLSKLLMNYVQKYHNNTLSIIYAHFKSDYFKALDDTRKKEDISAFRKFMYSQNKLHLKKLIKEIDNKKIKSQNRSNNKGFSFIF